MSGARRCAGLAAFAAATVLAACQPLPHPFADDRPPAALLAVPDSFDIAVDSVEGEPRAVAAKLPKIVAQELLKRNIAASDETTSKGSYKLDGRLEQHPDLPEKSAVTVFWRLRDPHGNIVSERSDRVVAPIGDWAGGSDERVAQLAAAGAAGLAGLLTDQAPKEQPGGGRVRVAVRKVDGAPGDGDGSLASSLTALLKRQDIELVDAQKGRPDLAVDCEVKVDPAKNGQQHVKIVWHVARAAGGEVGQVAQENEVPNGRLDGPWGDVAYSIAMAAEGGILQIVQRAAAPRERGGEVTTAGPPAAAPAASAPSIPVGPPVAGNLDAPEVNLPPVNVTPPPGAMPAPLLHSGASIPR